jgi:hypothetical protein
MNNSHGNLFVELGVEAKRPLLLECGLVIQVGAGAVLNEEGSIASTQHLRHTKPKTRRWYDTSHGDTMRLASAVSHALCVCNRGQRGHTKPLKRSIKSEPKTRRWYDNSLGDTMLLANAVTHSLCVCNRGRRGHTKPLKRSITSKPKTRRWYDSVCNRGRRGHTKPLKRNIKSEPKARRWYCVCNRGRRGHTKPLKRRIKIGSDHCSP